MLKKLTIIMLSALCAWHIASAAQPSAAGQKVPAAVKAAGEAMEVDGLHYASISKTNPFEIIAADGMALSEDLDNTQLVADLLQVARKHIGVRYVRGGKSPKGFDCSGFTSYVFGQFGISLSPSSSGQYTQGFSIKREEIEAGDLLFFKGSNSASSRVGHVGIAISNNPLTGEITFIHASRSAGIKIDKISAPYYAARFIGAKRVF